MAGYLHIKDSNQEIANKILKALTEVVGPVFVEAVPRIKDKVSLLVREKIQASPEMTSLIGGNLRFDIGLRESQAANAEVLFAETISNSVRIDYTKIKKSGRKLKGGITISIQPVSYNNIPDMPAEWDISLGQRADVRKLLLEFGDTLLVFGFEIQYGPYGRSGGAAMFRKGEGSWGLGSGVSRVPPAFSGTVKNNFITRTLGSKDFSSELSNIIKQVLSE